MTKYPERQTGQTANDKHLAIFTNIPQTDNVIQSHSLGSK